jgi:hypothetical protein
MTERAYFAEKATKAKSEPIFFGEYYSEERLLPEISWYTLTLQNFFIAGWALPTKNRQFQLLAMVNAHPTKILVESRNGKFQIHRRISVNVYIYAVGETNLF